MAKLTALFAILLVLMALPAAFIANPTERVSADGVGLADVYVNANTGDDSYDGSSPVHTAGSVGPVQHISVGTGLVADDGTVHVAAGTYYDNIHLLQNMDLVGDGALTTIIDGMANGSPVIVVASAPGQTNTISGFTIQNGRGEGGIYITSSHIVTINDCAIINNSVSVGVGGGGVYNDSGEVHMNRCTVSGNSATGAGGGISNICTAGPGTDFGKMYLTNCTIAGNTVTGAGGYGGGLYNQTDGDVTLLNVTIANNHCTDATSFGGGYSNSSPSSMYFKNCIVANNTAGISTYNNAYNAFGSGINSQGYNIDSQSNLYFTDHTDQVANPLLGPLQNNGGPTATMAITSASPAYNRGTSVGAPPTDQRGIARPQFGLFDIGAYEFAGSSDVRTASVNTSLGTASFSIDAGSISGLTNLPPDSIPCSPSGYIFPFGLFSYNITNLTPGQTVNVTITTPTPLPLGSKFFKCQNGSLTDFTQYVQQTSANTFVLTLKDGGQGDADGIANGTIVDPCGPAYNITSPRHGSSAQLPTVAQPPAAMANIAVQSASLSTAKVAPGAPVTVTANVANKGTAQGSTQIKLYVNGQEEAHQGVTLSSGSRTPVKFTVSRDEPGTYSVYVGSIPAGTFEVDQFADPNLVLYISGALILFALVGGVIFMSSRRR